MNLDFQDETCHSHRTTETAFCGTISQKNKKEIFTAGHTKKNCKDKDALLQYNADTFKYLCLGYKGSIFDRITLKVVYTVKETGKDGSKWAHTYKAKGQPDELSSSPNAWAFKCVDIKSRVDRMFNADEKAKYKNFYVSII